MKASGNTPRRLLHMKVGFMAATNFEMMHKEKMTKSLFFCLFSLGLVPSIVEIKAKARRFSRGKK